MSPSFAKVVLCSWLLVTLRALFWLWVTDHLLL